MFRQREVFVTVVPSPPVGLAVGRPAEAPGGNMSAPVILVAVKGLGIGGAEKLIVESARSWDRERFDYRVAYALPWKDQLVAPLRDLGIPVECIGTKRGLTPSSWWRLRRAAADAALVHAHLPAMGAVARMFAGRPVVYTEHKVDVVLPRPGAVGQPADLPRQRRGDRGLACGGRVGRRLPRPTPVVVPNGVSCELTPGHRTRSSPSSGSTGRQASWCTSATSDPTRATPTLWPPRPGSSQPDRT